jgi:hypothetical protein
MNEPVHAASFTRTLRLKVKAEAYPWLAVAAVEVNQSADCRGSQGIAVPALTHTVARV